METTTTTPRYLPTTECAKLIRKLLKAAFPATKFSVRSSIYSGGSSIRVGWTDGPRTEQVAPIAKQLEGASFDGMRDMKIDLGARVVAGELVEPGVDYVFVTRTVSGETELAKQAAAMIAARCSLDCDGKRFGNEWVDNLADGMARDVDFIEGVPSLDAAFNRIVLRRAS